MSLKYAYLFAGFLKKHFL